VSSRSLYQPEPTLNHRTSRSASYLPTRALLTSLTNPPAGTPQSYIQERFRQGQDRELSLMKTLQLTEDEKEEMKEQTKICEVIGRQQHGPHVENAARRTPHSCLLGAAPAVGSGPCPASAPRYEERNKTCRGGTASFGDKRGRPHAWGSSVFVLSERAPARPTAPAAPPPRLA